MPAAVTLHAHLRPAPSTFPILPPCIRAAAVINMYMGRFYPLPAPARGAVEAVLCSVFLVFLVPFHLEFRVEELVDVF